MSKKHTVIFLGAILILGALSIYDIAEYKNYKEKQFEKINKLNNNLIKVSQVVSQQQKDIEYLDTKIAENSVKIGELKRILSKLDDSYKSLFNLLFEVQSQKLTEKSQGAETTTPPITTEDVNPPSSSQVSAPPPKISTPIEREQEVVTIKRDNAPVPVKVIASCHRPIKLLKG